MIGECTVILKQMNSNNIISTKLEHYHAEK